MRKCPTTGIELGLSSAHPPLSEASFRCSQAFGKGKGIQNAASSSKGQESWPPQQSVGTLHDAAVETESAAESHSNSELQEGYCTSSEPTFGMSQCGTVLAPMAGPGRRESLSRDGNYLDTQMRRRQPCVGLHVLCLSTTISVPYNDVHPGP